MGQGSCPLCGKHLVWETSPYAQFRALASHSRTCDGGKNQKKFRRNQTIFLELKDEYANLLDELEALESKYYRDLFDALRPDILEVDSNGVPRTEEDKQNLMFIWKSVRDILIPFISYYQPTPSEMLRKTEWDMITGDTGRGKSLTGRYLIGWLLRTNMWIQYIYSNTIIYAGDFFYYKFPLRCGGECADCVNKVLCDGTCQTCRYSDDTPGKTYAGHRKTYPGHRLLHPKYREIRKVRDIEDYRNAIVFLDEVGSIIPGRGFASRQQWTVVQMAKNFRRHNCYVIMTEQVPDNLDRLLRANLRWIIDPEHQFDFNVFGLAVFPNHNAELSEYINKKRMNYGPEPQRYPRYPTWEQPVPDFPFPPMPWLALFYDTLREVKIMFQEPLDEIRTKNEAASVHAWIEKENPAGVMSNYYSRGDLPPESKIKQLIYGWNQVFNKHYVDDELLLIFFQYLKQYHTLEAALELPATGPRTCVCCGFVEGKTTLEEHEEIMRNYCRTLKGFQPNTARVSAKDMEVAATYHPIITDRFETLEAWRVRCRHGLTDDHAAVFREQVAQVPEIQKGMALGVDALSDEEKQAAIRKVSDIANATLGTHLSGTQPSVPPEALPPPKPKNKGGRPKGSKSKPKGEEKPWICAHGVSGECEKCNADISPDTAAIDGDSS